MAQEHEDRPIAFPDYPPMDESGMVDLWQIEANLAMTPAQRIQKFMRFLELQTAMRRARIEDHGNLSSSDPEASPSRG